MFERYGYVPAVAIAITSLLLVALAQTVATLDRAGPSTAQSPPAPPLVVPADSVVDQSFFVPSCVPAGMEVLAASGMPDRAEVQVDFLAQDDGRYPNRLVASTRHLVSAGQSIVVAIPSGPHLARRLAAIRLRTSDPGVVLELRMPPARWPGQLRVNGAWQGRQTLAMHPQPGSARCLFGVERLPAAVVVLAVIVVLVVTGLTAGLVCRGRERWRPESRAVQPIPWLPALVALASGAVWSLVVPPFEGPDEMAHVQYARYVAYAGGLPRSLPAPGAPFEGDIHEWVQPPGVYLAAALLFRGLGLDAGPMVPGPEPNRASRVNGGAELTLFEHGAPSPSAQTRLGALAAFRAMNLGWALLTVVLIALMLQEHLHDRRLAWAGAAALVLVPQWGAIMTMAGNDAAATAAATLAALLLLRLARAPAGAGAMVTTGVVIGIAVVTKLTTIFLLPMAVLALFAPAATGRRVRSAGQLALGAAGPIAASLGQNVAAFGDPFASDFKRAVLDASGFSALARVQPSPAEPAFWWNLKALVFEGFWARFGSLGAGPDAGSRVWWLYAAASIAIGLLVVAGASFAFTSRSTREPAPRTVSDRWVVLVAVFGTVAGLGGWILVNVAGRSDMVVHWTSRHVLPLSAPIILLAATGLRRLHPEADGSSWLWRALSVLALMSLAVGWLVALRHAVQQFYFGYP